MIENLITTILYVLPGFLILEIHRAAYPVKRRSVFALTAWSLIYGLINYAIVRIIDEKLLNFFLESNITDFPSYRFIFALLGFAGFLGLTRILIDKLRARIPFIKSPDVQSSWVECMRHLEKKNEGWLYVFLNDGSIYLGWIAGYTYDPDSENQDFILKGAIRFNNEFNKMYSIDGFGVYINTRDINRLEIVKGKEKIIKNTLS